MDRNVPKLPLELLTEILDGLPHRDIITLTRVSRLFNGLTLRFLYKEIVLVGETKFRQCFDTLAFNERIATHVKSLTIMLNSTFETTSVLNRTLRAALQNISASLVKLDLTACPFNLSYLLKRISFPRLSTFHTRVTIDKELVLFLQRNSHIESLSVGERIEASSARGKTIPKRIEMPSLRRFYGPTDAMPMFIPGSKVDQVFVNDCVTGASAVETVVTALEASTVPVTNLTFVDFTVYHPSIFEGLGSKLRNLTQLSFRHVFIGDWRPESQLMNGLRTALPHLPSLYRLTFHGFMSHIFGDADWASLNQDHRRLIELASYRDTLTIVDTIDNVPWGRMKTSGEWVPLCSGPEGLRWWFDKSSLLQPLQHNIFRAAFLGPLAFLNNRTPEQLTRAEREERAGATLPILRDITAKLLNRAFGMAPSSDEDDGRGGGDNNNDPERLQVPVRGLNQRQMRPYEDTEPSYPDTDARSIWDHFCSMVGLVSLYPIDPETEVEDFLADDEYPVLDETQKELASLMMDLMWAGVNRGELEIWRYLRNTEDEWKGIKLCLPLGGMAARLP
ncbi:hypothetical protein CC1G_07306 [Coprinopsis cinerea okayama7|uniref:F-box domain-containing protein n=1 Tax=Coprinopsis cinerea (strain Okayama-7 / 130 / ATCC MYA-4618 / FGSC 9003) TaxID=240176 RepID=A8NNN9_COPC7|nr:hypothetical protein CC1G_07306 [Coprinopsis cinerea okayama7\|eukprot:XP_001835164.1 hypothetical protein CC1G_07306 [Coprinopsis cinerea okayama7\